MNVIPVIIGNSVQARALREIVRAETLGNIVAADVPLILRALHEKRVASEAELKRINDCRAELEEVYKDFGSGTLSHHKVNATVRKWLRFDPERGLKFT